MTKNRRKRRGRLSVSARNVGVADADRDNPDEHVCVLEIREFDLFDDERAPQARCATAAVLFMALSDSRGSTLPDPFADGACVIGACVYPGHCTMVLVVAR
jgi:hypothetical protein